MSPHFYDEVYTYESRLTPTLHEKHSRKYTYYRRISIISTILLLTSPLLCAITYAAALMRLTLTYFDLDPVIFDLSKRQRKA